MFRRVIKNLIVLFLWSSTSVGFAQVFGEVLYNWDFATGLPSGWTNTSASGIGLWEYRGPSTTPNVSVGPRGTCSGAASPIASNTASNGFFLFDSNWWDDSVPGCGGLGTGPDPAPHTAWLTTGLLNFSGYSSVSITFLQQFRLFTATCKVQVSINGGTTWVDAGQNTGTNSANPVWQTFNLSSIAANQSNVRIRFEFSGTYYWWQIDDISIYAPNDNDLLLTNSGYTVNPTPVNIYNELEYDQYPITMIPPLRFRGTATNIGGFTQTGVNMTSRVLNSSDVQIHTQTTPNQTMLSGATVNFQSPNSYTPPATLGDYNVEIRLSQNQTDENPLDNRDTLDYTISPFTFARDEGPLENVFVPSSSYNGQPYEIGNIFEGFTANRKCTSVAVGIGEGTQVGSTIQAVVYNETMETVLAQSDPYVVNLADLNQEGEEFTVVLQLNTPVQMFNDTIYLAMVKNLDGNAPMRIGRSGIAPQNTSFVNYYNFNALFFLATMPMVRMNIFLNTQTPGCMDPTAMNYNPAATVTDGGCRYPGCTIEGALNFDPDANWYDGSCIVPGCTNPIAINFNPLANLDDGSCLIGGCTNPEATNFDPTATLDDGTCIVPGCTDVDADNFNPDATEDNGSCFYLGCTNPQAANYDPDATVDDGTCIIAGCTNPIAVNFNPNANLDDGSCLIAGCTNPVAINFDPQANLDDGSCIIEGCTNPDAANYNPQANANDGSCIFLGCTDPDALNFDPQANENDGSCIYPGCTDPLADNFNPLASVNDGSCIYTGCIDPTAFNYDPTANQDDGSCLYGGCTNINAVNYDPDADVDDGSCQYSSPTFAVSPMMGCVPFTIEVINQTVIGEDYTCEYFLNGELIQSGCVDAFTYLIQNEGNLELEYRVTIGGVSESAFATILANEIPIQPVLTFDEDNFTINCLNCDADLLTWELDNVPVLGTNPTLNVFDGTKTENGWYVITATNLPNCSTQSQPLLVLEAFLEVNQTDFCAPSLLQVTNLTDLPNNAVSVINFGIGGNQVMGATTLPFNYFTPGEYTINIHVTSGSVTASVSETIIVSDGIIPQLNWDAQVGFVSCLNCEAIGTAVWTIDGEPVVGEGPFPDNLGQIYQVELTNEFGCVESGVIFINSVESFEAQNLAIYPIPAKDFITIESPLEISEIQIFDMRGALIKSEVITSGVRPILNVSDIPNGHFVLVARSEQSYLRKAFQITR